MDLILLKWCKFIFSLWDAMWRDVSLRYIEDGLDSVFAEGIRTPYLLTILFLKCEQAYFYYALNRSANDIVRLVVNRVDTVQTLQLMTSDQGIYCSLLPVYTNSFGKYRILK